MRYGSEQEALGFLPIRPLGVRQGLQPVHALLDAGVALTPARLEVGFLIGGGAGLGAQLSEDSLVVVGGLQQAVRDRES